MGRAELLTASDPTLFDTATSFPSVHSNPSTSAAAASASSHKPGSRFAQRHQSPSPSTTQPPLAAPTHDTPQSPPSSTAAPADLQLTRSHQHQLQQQQQQYTALLSQIRTLQTTIAHHGAFFGMHPPGALQGHPATQPTLQAPTQASTPPGTVLPRSSPHVPLSPSTPIPSTFLSSQLHRPPLPRTRTRHQLPPDPGFPG